MTEEMLETLPEELQEFCDGILIRVEDMPEDSLVDDLELQDAYMLPCLYRNGKELAPGIESRTANDAEDHLVIYRRPLLDMWVETQDDLGALLRQVMIDELGQQFDFSDDEIDEMHKRHYQGML